MFERVLFEVVTTSKSAIKLNCCPARHLLPTPPITWTFLTAASCTSFAVHCSLPPPPAVYSSCKQLPWAKAACGASTAVASSAKISENFLQQPVRILIFFPPQKLGVRGFACGWIHVSWEPVHGQDSESGVTWAHNVTEAGPRNSVLLVEMVTVGGKMFRVGAVGRLRAQALLRETKRHAAGRASGHVALLGQKRHLTDLQTNFGRWLVELAKNARVEPTSASVRCQHPKSCNLITTLVVDALLRS